MTVASIVGCQQFTSDGKAIKTISHPNPKEKTLRASDSFIHLYDGDPEKQNRLKETSLGLEYITAPDYITKYQRSSCGRYFYLASKSGLHILDAVTEDILATVTEEFGVQNFEELAPGLIAIATWSGVKLYKL